MATEGFKRKLTAVFSADVVSYSRLMGEDDDATVLTLTGHRKIACPSGITLKQDK